MNSIDSALNGPLKNPPFSDAELQKMYGKMLDTAWKALWNHNTEHSRDPEHAPEWVDEPVLFASLRQRNPPTSEELAEINRQIGEIRAKFESFLTPHPDQLVELAQPAVDAIGELGIGSGAKGGEGSNYSAQPDFAGAADNDLLQEGFKGTAAEKFFTHYPARHTGRYTNQVYALNAVDGAMKLYAGIHHQARTDIYTIAKEAENKLQPMMREWDGEAGGDDLRITLAVVATVGTVVAAIASGGGAAVAAAGTAAAMWSRVGAAAAIGNSFYTLKSNKGVIASISGSNAEEVLRTVNTALDEVRSGVESQKEKLVEGIGKARAEMNRMWSNANGSTNVLQVPAPGEVREREGG